MEILLLGIYSFFVWLIFIKLKWLPWNAVSQVTVAVIPIVGLTAMILLLNIHSPSSHDVRVFKYTVPIVSQVRGRVTEVPIEEGNRLVRTGDVLFKVDPTPYQLAVDSLSAQLIGAEGGAGQLREQLAAAAGNTAALRVRIDLARRRVEQNRELATSGAGNRFDLEQAQTNVSELTSQLAAARASGQKVKEKLAGRVGGDISEVAQVKAQIATAKAQLQVSQAQTDTTRAELDNARWSLAQTTVLAPGNGRMVNVNLRPGFFVAGMPFNEVMTFVDNDYQIFALFGQNELHQVEPGDEVEITLDTYPGRIIKAHVDSVIWAQSQGQLDAQGNLPSTVISAPPGRFPVKLVVADVDKSLFLAAGARGSAAIYTEHLAILHIIRKVLMRVSSYFDYIIIKHSISVGH
jgi:multidrug resistance efflux pump